jgi:hypothetical protein
MKGICCQIYLLPIRREACTCFFVLLQPLEREIRRGEDSHAKKKTILKPNLFKDAEMT